MGYRDDYDRMRLEQRLRDETDRADSIAQEAASYRQGQYSEMQREYEAWREEIVDLEEERDIIAAWSARWKALAKRQRKDLAVARLIIADLYEALGEEQDGEAESN